MWSRERVHCVRNWDWMDRGNSQGCATWTRLQGWAVGNGFHSAPEGVQSPKKVAHPWRCRARSHRRRDSGGGWQSVGDHAQCERVTKELALGKSTVAPAGRRTGTREDEEELVRGSRRAGPKSQGKVKPVCEGAWNVSQWPGLSLGKGHQEPPVDSHEPHGGSASEDHERMEKERSSQKPNVYKTFKSGVSATDGFVKARHDTSIKYLNILRVTTQGIMLIKWLEAPWQVIGISGGSSCAFMKRNRSGGFFYLS